jgi:hypothetical protein
LSAAKTQQKRKAAAQAAAFRSISPLFCFLSPHFHPNK